MRNALKMIVYSALLMAALFSLSSLSAASSAHAATTNVNSHAISSGSTGHVVSDATMSPDLSCPPTISEGSTRTSTVKLLQEDLNRYYSYGYFKNSPYNFHPPLAKDGDFGSNTRNAVLDFQTAYKPGWHITVDGIVGPQTWNLLGECS